MAARRGKSQATRNGGSGLPGWAWLVIGILLTLLAVIFAPRLLKSGNGNDFLRLTPKPNPDALPATVSEDSTAIAPDVATPARPEPPKYDFYTLLPGEGVRMTDAEVAVTAKAEASPTPVDTSPATDADNGHTDATAALPASDAAPPARNARYTLQAGAFGASGDAEAVKAKIALLGLNARVESAQINGKTLYRVRLGPYGSASELADAKGRLAGGGLPAMAVKTN